MGRHYNIDLDPRREEIIKAVLNRNRSIRRIAKDYDVDYSSLYRYVTDRLAGDLSALEEERRTSTLSIYRDMLHRARAVLDRAEAQGDDSLVLKAIESVRRLLELKVKNPGSLKDAESAETGNGSEALKRRLIDLCKAHPELSQDILEAIRQ